MRNLLFAYFFGAPKRMAAIGMRTQAIDHRIAGKDSQDYFDPTNMEAAERLRRMVAEEHAPTHAFWAEGAPEHVFMKSHYVYSPNHPLIAEPGRAITIVRHPKDVLLSSLNFEQMRKGENEGDTRAFVEAFIERGGVAAYSKKGYGTWANNWRSWVQQAPQQMPVLLVSYEALLAEPVFTFGQVLNFLGATPGQNRLEFAVRTASFENLQSMEKKQRDEEGSDSENDKLFFNKGQAGGTISDTLGLAMDDQFDEAFAPQIEQFNSLAARGVVRVAGQPQL